MVTFRQVDKSYFDLYDQVSMKVLVRSEFRVDPIEEGLGGLLLREVPVEPYIKDLSVYERATEYEQNFNIGTWKFYMAFDGDIPIGAMTVAGTTDGMNMLYGRKDACVLWDIRVDDAYKKLGIGSWLLQMGIEAAKADGYRQMIIECQNNNVPACRFYQKHGAVLSKIDKYAYYLDEECRNEVQFVWYLDLK